MNYHKIKRLCEFAPDNQKQEKRGSFADSAAGNRKEGFRLVKHVPKVPGVQKVFEFLLCLIRKWFPDAHEAHPDVGGVSGSGP